MQKNRSNIVKYTESQKFLNTLYLNKQWSNFFIIIIYLIFKKKSN